MSASLSQYHTSGVPNAAVGTPGAAPGGAVESGSRNQMHPEVLISDHRPLLAATGNRERRALACS
jgi:hypothetical protein